VAGFGNSDVTWRSESKDLATSADVKRTGFGNRYGNQGIVGFRNRKTQLGIQCQPRCGRIQGSVAPDFGHQVLARIQTPTAGFGNQLSAVFCYQPIVGFGTETSGCGANQQTGFGNHVVLGKQGCRPEPYFWPCCDLLVGLASRVAKPACQTVQSHQPSSPAMQATPTTQPLSPASKASLGAEGMRRQVDIRKSCGPIPGLLGSFCWRLWANFWTFWSL